jgi:hypothetical protein
MMGKFLYSLDELQPVIFSNSTGSSVTTCRFSPIIELDMKSRIIMPKLGRCCGGAA